MKKKIYVLLIICLVLLSGCKKKTEKEKVDTREEIPEEEKYTMGYTLNDGRRLTMNYNPPYELDENHVSTVGEELFGENIKLNEFLKDLKKELIAKDGGSTLYSYSKDTKKYGELDFNVLVCNVINGSKDIYFSLYDIPFDVCRFILDEDKDITMKIKEDTLNKSGVTVVITDNSNKKYSYGEDYYLEVYKDGKYQKLKTANDLLFTSIGYAIEKGESREFDVNWDYGYGELPKGKYRVIKSYIEEGAPSPKYISAEFTIK